MSEEVNLTTCKICRQLKHRILLGKYPNNRDKKWVSESGKQWCGTVCPECHANKVKSRYKKVDEVKKEDANG